MKVIINESQIIYETPRAVLVKVPDTTNSRFWLSKKMVREYGKRYSILLPDKWEYKIISGKKQTSEETVTIDYLADKFEAQIEGTINLRSKVETHIPEPKEPIKRDVEDEFIR